MTSQPTLAVDS